MLTDDLAGTGGRIKERPEDFIVEEIPAYDPTGEGEHVMVKVRKLGLTTDQIARTLARAAEVRGGDVGFAGRKDKQAVTTQWFSVSSKRDPSFFEELEGEGFSVLEAQRHRNKLRTGHLKGNRFTVVVRGVEAEALDIARAVLERVETEGLPNAFGPQRFGRYGDNAQQTLRWVLGDGRPPRDKRKRKMMFSSLQALLFNRVVQLRIEQGALTRAFKGDVIKIHSSGGMFVAEDPEEVTERVRRREVSPTGPIFGSRMWWPEDEALDFETSVLEEAGLTTEHLDRYRREGSGSRRPVRVFPEEASVQLDGDALTLSFSLDAGAFATTLLAEITKAEDLYPPTALVGISSLDNQPDDHSQDSEGEHNSDDALST